MIGLMRYKHDIIVLRHYTQRIAFTEHFLAIADSARPLFIKISCLKGYDLS
jgi:hypothetical protein